MGKVSQHLAAFHKMASENHSQLHDCYKSLSGFTKATKSEMKPDEQDSLCDTLDKIADCHKAAAAYHKDALAECTKAIEAADLEKHRVVPTNVSAVTPDVPQGVRAVPRFGGRPIPAQTHPVSAGGVDFNKLIGLGDLDEL